MSDDGLALLASRVAALPAVLAETHARPLPDLDDLRTARRWITTGVGGSEGPARVFAAALREGHGPCASFVPLSRLACDDLALDGAALAVFSQGLSPNARIALGRNDFGAALLVTALDRDALDAAGVRPDLALVHHAPAREDRLLVRVAGPAAATLVALRLADALRGAPSPHASEVPDAVRDALAEPAPRLDPALPVALLGCDLGMDLLHGLRWKWLEAFRRSDASVWDALGFAHGPLQLTAERPTNLVLLPRDDAREQALFTRLTTLLAGEGHRVLRLGARLPGAWSFFEHDARWAAVVLATLRAHPRELLHWPLQGRDDALYGLDTVLAGQSSHRLASGG